MNLVDELVEIFTTKDGRKVEIWIDDDGEGILVKSQCGSEVGRFELSLRENCNTSYYYITWMYLNLKDSSYTNQGIGRAALEFHRKVFNMPILAAENDGHAKQDGSHLTQDAPAFVGRMRELGIIVPSAKTEKECDHEDG